MSHYLLAVSPLRGHVMPMINIGMGLQMLGHDITVLTGSEFAGAVADAGLPMMALPHSVHIDPPEAAPVLVRRLPVPARRFWLGRAELDSVFAKPLADEARSLLSVMDRHPADAIVADVTFTGVLPLLLSERPRPPVVVCGVGPLTISSIDTPPFGMAWQPEPGVDYRRMTAAAHKIIMGSAQRKLNRALREANSSATGHGWPTASCN